jgi:hypothetical protein
MKIINNTKMVSLFLIFLGVSTSFAGTKVVPDPGEQLQQNSAAQVSVVASSDPEDQWLEYLDKRGLHSGNNKKKGKTFFIAFGVSRVGKKPNERGFIDSRRIAYSKAELLAKSDMAESVGAFMESGRSLELMQPGEDLPPALKKTRKQLSLFSKAAVLANKEMDALIRNHDPEWDGTGKSKEEKIQKIAEARETFEQNMKQKARLFLQGATPIFNAEGPNSDGMYSVGVGIVWSSRMALVAESMYNSDVEYARGKPGLSIRDQLKRQFAKNPNFFAATNGVRVWRNEKGERIVVSFASVELKRSTSIASKKSGMIARSMVAQFVSEAVTSNSELEGGEVVTDFNDGSTESVNTEQFQTKIKANSKKIKLQGVGTVYTWKGKHPNSRKNKMYVNVMAWTPESHKTAHQMEALSEKQEESMGRQGMTGGRAKSSESDSHGGGLGSKGVAAGGLSGAGSSFDDF